MKIELLDNGLNKGMFVPATTGAAGIDLRAILDNPITIFPDQHIFVPTGIKVAIPENWVGLISPRSGLGTKGLVLGNMTGVIDSDYRGEIMVCLWNRHPEKKFEVQPYDRIAQMYVVPHYSYSNLDFVDHLDTTERGEGGFGSTGSN